MFSGYSPDEIRIIAEFKRFKERFIGAPDFREAGSGSSSDRKKALAGAGIGLDSPSWEYLWKHLENPFHRPITPEDLSLHPELKLFLEWQNHFGQQSQQLGEELSASESPPLLSWRQRAIQRLKSRVGTTVAPLNYPLFAYELSLGCTVNCWFCGVSAGKFGGFFPYTPEHARLWQDILLTGRDLFGPISKNVICYHATEPFDNPDYLRFLQDLHGLNNLYPQTTTAVPLRNPSLIAELIRLRESNPMLFDRFSVLSGGILKSIHRTFSAFELRHVELVLQYEGALSFITGSGRAREHQERQADANRFTGSFDPEGAKLDPRTGECLCGFLVNLVERSVKLITPCPASDRWPSGYRIHDHGTFNDAAGYRAFLEESVKRHMPGTPDWQGILGFRSDLSYARAEGGFSLTSRFFRHSLKGEPWYGLLGDLIASGTASGGEIFTRLAAEGVLMPEVTSAFGKLFDKGVLKEFPDD